MPLERLFSAGSLLPQDSMRFVIAGSADELPTPMLTVPDDWSLEAAHVFQDSLCLDKPAALKAIEENTMPSWLWQRRAATATETSAETSVLDVFERIAGAASYRGWKLGLWQDEIEASIFFDEVQALLLTRRLVLAPAEMARMGLDWAYGLAAKPRVAAPKPHHQTAALILQNDTIDGILRRTQPHAHDKWTGYLQRSQSKDSTHIAFADTMAEWGSLPCPHDAPRGMLNMLAFRTPDGEVDHAGLAQAARLAVLLLELHADTLTAQTRAERPVALGIGNLAALMMSIGLPYDGEAARGTAAAICAILSATATATSALLAAKLGPCAAFGANREAKLRALRNKLRATFGEKNDYDRLSVLPQTLELDSGVDLVLISAARYASEEALRLTQEHGLRNLQLMSMFTDADMAALMDASTQGVGAETTLTCDYAIGGEQFERRVRPAVRLALEKLGYESDDQRAILDHIAGYHTLVGAPTLNHYDLRQKGFDDAALTRVEAVLPFVDHLRHAFTPWVVGLAFCRDTLGIDEASLQSHGFDLLAHLGFTAQDIAVANGFCCGHRTARGVSELAEADAKLFDTADRIAPEAQLRMAAAVQPYITGDTGLVLEVPNALKTEQRGALVIKAWELGLKGVTLQARTPPQLPQPATTAPVQSIKRASPRLATKPTAPTGTAPRVMKPKAPTQSVTLKQPRNAPTARSGLRSKRG